MADPDAFAGRLRSLLDAVGLTAYALSQRSGVRQQTISKLLRGERQPSWRLACKLAEALGVTPNDFLPLSRGPRTSSSKRAGPDAEDPA